MHHTIRARRATIALGLVLPLLATTGGGIAIAADEQPTKRAKKVRLIASNGARANVAAATGPMGSPSYAGTGEATPRRPGPDDTSYGTPAGGGSAMESVIAPDRRTQVTATTSYPARATVLLHYQKTSGGGTFQCTGFFIGPDTIATAAHCVHHGSSSGFFVTSSFKIYPGRNGSTIPYTCPGGATVGARRLFTNATWAASGAETSDYGAIHTTCPIGQTTGWYGYWSTEGLSSVTGPVNTQGYPTDKAPATQWLSNNCTTSTSSTVFSQCMFAGTTSRQLFYKNDTHGGQSGSPLYRSIHGCGTCAVGIHAYGLHGSSPHNVNNHGTRMEKNVISFLSFVRNGGIYGSS